jgi:hypothetical protein
MRARPVVRVILEDESGLNTFYRFEQNGKLSGAVLVGFEPCADYAMRQNLGVEVCCISALGAAAATPAPIAPTAC